MRFVKNLLNPDNEVDIDSVLRVALGMELRRSGSTFFLVRPNWTKIGTCPYHEVLEYECTLFIDLGSPPQKWGLTL